MQQRAIFRSSLRGLRHPAAELRVLGAAVLLSAMAVSAVGLISDRVQTAMQRQTAEAIGADLVVESRLAKSDELASAALDLGLQISHSTEFASLVRNADEQTVTGIKAVAEGYPLRGQMLLADDLFGEARVAQGIPEPGTAWADDRLLSTLKLSPGDEINVGRARLEITRVLRLEPDRGGGFLALTPRLMINAQDIEATGLIAQGSRVTWRLLVAGSPAALETFADQVTALKDPDRTLKTPRDARPEIDRALQRTDRFLALAVLSTLLLCGAAIALAAHGFARRSQEEIALLKSLGASRRAALAVVLLRVVAVALAGATLGALAGFAIQETVVRLATRALQIPASPADWSTPALGIAVALLTAVGFSLPLLLRLVDVSPMQVLRSAREAGQRRWPMAISVLLILGATALLFPDAELLSVSIGAAVATLLLIAGVGWLWLKVMSGIRLPDAASRHGLAQLRRQMRFSLLQIACLGLGLTALLMISIVRNDLLGAWQASLPDDAPNYFLVNMQTDEIPEVRAKLQEGGLAVPVFYPMVRARLLTVNGESIDPASVDNPEGERMLTRAWNLSFSETLPPDNELVDGEFWTPEEINEPQMSIEQHLVETLGLKMGDELRFDIAGETLTVTVTSVREVDWDNMRANFFALTPPPALDGLPATWIAAFHVPDNKRELLPELARAFPTVIVLDVAAIVQQVKRVMDRASLAIQGVFVFTIAGGVLVLIACIQIGARRRRHETALLRSLGASTGWILRSQATELLSLGAATGLAAATCAQMTAWALATWIFDYDYLPSLPLWLWGCLLAMAGVVLAGLLGLRGSLNVSPMRALR